MEYGRFWEEVKEIIVLKKILTKINFDMTLRILTGYEFCLEFYENRVKKELKVYNY